MFDLFKTYLSSFYSKVNLDLAFNHVNHNQNIIYKLNCLNDSTNYNMKQTLCSETHASISYSNVNFSTVHSNKVLCQFQCP